jgi:hypothetical protein
VGSGLEISLTGVETVTGYVPTTGGMRLGFTPREGDVPLPDLHAGDEVAALVEAWLPLVYRDAGAFDRREFLARQDIHVLATLRASTLLEKQVEYEMLAENDPAFLPADVLKVAHHGSKNSTMPELLNVIAPQISIISAGEVNPYGYPSPELLQRLEESGTRIYRTDQDGAVRVLTDGENLQVSCFIDCSNRTIASAKTQPPNEQQTGRH